MPIEPANPDPPAHVLPTPLDNLLSRPIEQRLREYKHRFAQSAVFGLPVIALHSFGRALGGPEADKWVGLFEALLGGWVMYVGAAGMLFEGLRLLARARRVTGELLIAGAALALYLGSLPSVAGALVTGDLWYPICIHLGVVLILLWTGLSWRRFAARRAVDESTGSCQSERGHAGRLVER